MTDLLYYICGACAVVLGLTVGGWVALLRCKHRNLSAPVNGVQWCRDCGKWRMWEVDGYVGMWTR